MLPDKYWSEFFGLTIEQFRKPGLQVVVHKELADYNGAYIFKTAQSVIISVPEDLKQTVEKRLKSSISNNDVLSEQFAKQLFENVERTIGPCYQGYYANVTEDRNQKDTAIRLLTPSDQPNLDSFRQQIEQEAWEHSSIAPDKVTFGYFQDANIVAAACLDMWTDNVANMGLVTLPSQRGKGYSKRLCEFATQFGLRQDYLMVYQTLLSNIPAVAVAMNTGYLEYANHLAVRFGND